MAMTTRPLALTREDFMAITDAVYCILILVNEKGTPVYWNGAACDLERRLPGSCREIIKKLEETVDVVHCEGRYVVTAASRDFICHIRPWQIKQHRRGSILIVHESCVSSCAVQELNVVRDVVEEIDAVLEAGSTGLLVLDSRGMIKRVNHRFESLYGLDRKTILGKSIKMIMKETQIPQELLDKALHQQEHGISLVEYKGRKLVYTATPGLDRNHQMRCLVVDIQDVSAWKILWEKFKEQRKHMNEFIRKVAVLSSHSEDMVIGRSQAMQKVMHLIEVVSDVDSTVLITGESGTGKEVVVNEIYHRSRRRDKPFLKINCGAIPEELFESELFGYESGAFTGARRQGKAGFFELADQGVLLLDEIGELSLAAQAKLLRVIQNQEVQRIGAARSIHVDVRLIAATNRNLWDMVQQGTFRSDLYYRLHVIHIHIPPLRERREDIIPLATQFLHTFNAKYEKHKVLTPALCRLLMVQDWPGNIRELENAIETLVILTEGDDLQPEDFISQIQMEESEAIVTIRRLAPWNQTMAEVERKILQMTADQCHSTRAMADILHIDQSTISRKMQKYGLSLGRKK